MGPGPQSGSVVPHWRQASLAIGFADARRHNRHALIPWSPVGCRCLNLETTQPRHPQDNPMAISPSVLADWIQPGAALTAVFGLAGFLWAEMRAMRAEFKAEMQAMRAEFKAEIQASEARQNKRIDELKDDMKEIKADIKSLLLAQQGLQRPAGAKV